MIIPKSLFRILQKNINIEKYMYKDMLAGTYEHTPNGWFDANQAVFTAGMEYALHIIKNPEENDVFIIPGENIKSNEFKNMSKIKTRMKYVDN